MVPKWNHLNGFYSWDVEIGGQVRGVCDCPGNKQRPEESELYEHSLPSEVHPIWLLFQITALNTFG